MPPEELAAAITQLRSAAPDVGVGLHFNCVVGRPLTATAAMTDSDGEFVSLPSLVWRILTRRVKPADVASECEAQLGRLRSMAGGVTHLDSHLHAHALPVVWDAVQTVARRNSVAHVRFPVEPFTRNFFDIGATLSKAVVFSSLGVATHGRVGAPLSETFAGMSIRGGENFEPRLLRLLDTLPSGLTELMVHPGHADPGVLRYTGYLGGRPIELAALTSRRVRERLARGDIQLTHF